MNNQYDTKKSQENLIKRGISFDDVGLFEWETAVTKQDIRYEYGESRFISIGFINDRCIGLDITRRRNSSNQF